MNQPKRVLVIDDEEEICYVIGDFLRLAGLGVAHTTDPNAGIEIARRSSPDLILLDVLMPKKTGIEVLDSLKGDPRTMAIPVVMLTGMADDGTRFRSLASYCEDYITKPVRYETLIPAITAVWQRRGAWRQDEAAPRGGGQ